MHNGRTEYREVEQAGIRWHLSRAGDPCRAVPVPAEVAERIEQAGVSLASLRDLQELAEIDATLDVLRPLLRRVARSPKRLMSTGRRFENPHRDEQLRIAAPQMLRARGMMTARSLSSCNFMTAETHCPVLPPGIPPGGSRHQA